jgi:hypothetical protein
MSSAPTTGKLVQPKPPAERKVIADRIKAINVDVLAVQEVEDIGVLRQFALEDLEGMYPYQVLVEGNDQRLIDVGLLSRYPIGAVTSWRFRRASRRAARLHLQPRPVGGGNPGAKAPRAHLYALQYTSQEQLHALG